jgi:hypothetical protein
MYKARITKWKLERNNKEDNMRAILRKNAERNAIGKNTHFSVRGRIVTMEEVEHYFKRKRGLPAPRQFDPPTPSDVSCRTPSPVPVESPGEDSTQLVIRDQSTSRNSNSEYLQADEFDCPSAVGNSEVIEGQAFEQCLSGNHELFSSFLEMVLVQISEVPRSPLAPASLLVPERLIYTVKTYMVVSFQGEKWKDLDKVAINSSTGRPWQFEGYFSIALRLLENGSVIQFRRSLSLGFEMVKHVISNESPLAFEQLFEVLLVLSKAERFDIQEMLTKFVVELGTQAHQKEHPIIHFCRFVGALDPISFRPTIIQSWRAVVEAFDSVLGQFHPYSFLSNLFFLQVRSNDIDTERSLRRLLSQYKQSSPIVNPQYVDTIAVLGWNLLIQSRYAEAEYLGSSALKETEGGSAYTRIKMAKLLADSEFYQGKIDVAEGHLRYAIQTIVSELGFIEWTIGCMAELESWLRYFGKLQEADNVRIQIQEALGKDECDL